MRPSVAATPAEVALRGPAVAQIVADDEAHLREVNAAAVELLRYPEAQLLQMQVWDITPESQRAGAREFWREFIAQGHQAGEYQVQTGDGRVVTVSYEAVSNFRPGLHLSLLTPVAAGHDAGRPLDECPYDRPFPAGFDRCPLYREAMSGGPHLHGRQGAPVRTCVHLAAAKFGPRRAGYYGRCRLGDALARTRISAASSESN